MRLIMKLIPNEFKMMTFGADGGARFATSCFPR